MRVSQFFLVTQKETPADAELVSHKLMLRAGMIRKLAAGIYTWLPLGLRVLQKVEAVVREEMTRAGAVELLLPQIMPAELWHQTGRWETFGTELLKMVDRHDREFCFGPTHEESITDMAKHFLKSYKQLPVNLFQIQTKFRDEIRPRFGVMRSREFLMKDAYSFHLNSQSLSETYDVMFEAYNTIFSRLGLKFRSVLADTGAIGGDMSHEFHVLADSGEDVLAFSDEGDYAANVERASTQTPDLTSRPAPAASLNMIDTPGQRTIEEVSTHLGIPAKQSVKTLLVQGTEDRIVALVLRGDHELNELKAEKLEHVATPLSFVDDSVITSKLNCKPGSIGPIGLDDITLYVDHHAAVLSDFVCGANQDDKHYINTNWERDVALTNIADLRRVQPGDISPDGNGKLQFTRGIEVGHIFQLGNKYSKAMNATVLDEGGKSVPLEMGCYGIGISRIVAAAIEQNHDKNGIIWPDAMAPFQIAIVPINLHKSYRLRDVCESLYCELRDAGFDVLLDDRKERPGVLFADHDLIGIPHRLIVSEKNLDNNLLEYKARTDTESRLLPLDNYLIELQNVVV